MKTNPLVSIIMNCFNGEKYLEEAISSIRNQIYTNWEIIFWDNCSTDKSAKIFKKYSDKRFKYYLATKHTGISEAKNFAIEKSSGELIAFLDVDDMWTSNKLYLQIPLFADASVGAAYSNFWLIKNNEKKKKIFSKRRLAEGYIYDKIINNYNVGLVTTILRKDFYNLLKENFDKKYSIIADFDLILKFAKKYKFCCVQEPLAYYRLHTDNYSIINKNNEISELELWLSENTLVVGKEVSKKIQNRIDIKKFIQSKIKGDLVTCLKLIPKMEKKITLIKMLTIFLVPRFILTKISWFYQMPRN